MKPRCCEGTGRKQNIKREKLKHKSQGRGKRKNDGGRGGARREKQMTSKPIGTKWEQKRI